MQRTKRPKTDEKRGAIMRSVKSKDTSAELLVRKFVHRLGYRYRLHAPDLPGKPDLVFRRSHRAIFVHGCFWHGHACARGARVPVANRAYWIAKIQGNRLRDRRTIRKLVKLGWKALVVWECELREFDKAAVRITRFLGPPAVDS